MTGHCQPDLDAVRAEMDYRDFEGSFGQDQSVSIPAQLRFTEPPAQNTVRFHNALDVHGYTPVDTDPDKRATDDRPHYDGEVCSREHYARVKILVFRDGCVRLYPKDDYVPTSDELGDLIHALTIGFRADLEHDPIDKEEVDR